MNLDFFIHSYGKGLDLDFTSIKFLPNTFSGITYLKSFITKDETLNEIQALNIIN